MADVPGIAEVDLTGFVRDRAEPGVWRRSDGVHFAARLVRGTPDLGAAFEDADALLAECAGRVLAAGGAVVEAGVEHPGDLPAVYQLSKHPLPAPDDASPDALAGAGRRYLAGYLVPRAGAVLHLDLWADEPAGDGARAAFVRGRVPDGLLHANGPDLADGPDVDETFPAHGLSRVRAAARQVVPSLRFEDWFVASPPFGAGAGAGLVD